MFCAAVTRNKSVPKRSPPAYGTEGTGAGRVDYHMGRREPADFDWERRFAVDPSYEGWMDVR